MYGLATYIRGFLKPGELARLSVFKDRLLFSNDKLLFSNHKLLLVAQALHRIELRRPGRGHSTKNNSHQRRNGNGDDR